MTDRKDSSLKLHTKFAGCDIRWYKSLDSTNNKAKELAGEDAPHGLLVAADRQTAGKGRIGKRWESPEGRSVYMSLLLRPDLKPVSASMLTLVAALAVAAALREVGNTECFIKWPNDIVINKKKVCGILTEMDSRQNRLNFVVVGIGINVNEKKFPDAIREKATSLLLATGQRTARNRVIQAVMEHFEIYYEKFMKFKSMETLIGEYNEQLINCGRQVKIMERARTFTGTALGIDSSGALQVEMTDGIIQSVSSGEVSVRGLYDYI